MQTYSYYKTYLSIRKNKQIIDLLRISDRIQHPNNLFEGLGGNYEESQSGNFLWVSIEVKQGKKKGENVKNEELKNKVKRLAVLNILLLLAYICLSS